MKKTNLALKKPASKNRPNAESGATPDSLVEREVRLFRTQGLAAVTAMNTNLPWKESTEHQAWLSGTLAELRLTMNRLFQCLCGMAQTGAWDGPHPKGQVGPLVQIGPNDFESTGDPQVLELLRVFLLVELAVESFSEVANAPIGEN